MPAELFSLAAPSLARAAVAASIIVIIYAVHAAYFAANKAISSQQRIALEDLTDLYGRGLAGVGGLTIVHGDRQQFDVATRSTNCALFPLPAVDRPVRRPVWRRLTGQQLFSGVEVRCTLICDDDVIVRETAIFLYPLKVAGDLIVEGHATFLQPVVINGVMRVVGSAHFAAGVVAKGDALIEGALAVGSDSQAGWAVIRELGLKHRLKLNGTLVTGRAVDLRTAA